MGKDRQRREAYTSATEFMGVRFMRFMHHTIFGGKHVEPGGYWHRIRALDGTLCARAVAMSESKVEDLRRVLFWIKTVLYSGSDMYTSTILRQADEDKELFLRHAEMFVKVHTRYFDDVYAELAEERLTGSPRFRFKWTKNIDMEWHGVLTEKIRSFGGKDATIDHVVGSACGRTEGIKGIQSKALPMDGQVCGICRIMQRGI